jgi:hypothetical protein
MTIEMTIGRIVRNQLEGCLLGSALSSITPPTPSPFCILICIGNE